MKKTLCGRWEFGQSGKDVRKSAEVPGCNYLDLMRNSDIPDPFSGLNEKEVQWVAREDWEYRRSFDITKEELLSDEIFLVCKMLDTVCTVFINGKEIGRGKNCHIEYDFPVKKYLSEGVNEICILFYSPVNYVDKIYRAEGAPVNCNGQNGIVHIRKPQYHFGWDWGPVLPPSGISGDIYLEFVNAAKLAELSVSQKHSDSGVTVTACADIMRLSENADISCEITLTYPDGTRTAKSGESAEFFIDTPELWWTRELSGKEEQPLYTVSASLSLNGKLIGFSEKKIGLRVIELDRSRDEYGSNFRFILNGVPLFIKGANYIPPDSFMTRFGTDRLKKLLDAARFSNINMLRVWGGGFYGSDELYGECDRRGILIWQDFQFACQAYPFFKPDFLENVKNEIEYNVKRIGSHASLALWCGNNEIEDMSSAWLHMRKYIEWTEKFFYDILENEIRKYDASTPYIPGSPCGVSHGKGVSCDNVGDTHLWGVWHGLRPMNFYRKRMTRFCSEFGFESLPDIKTVRSFAKNGKLSLSDEVFSAHQKCLTGNDKMLWYVRSRFELPEKFEDMIYLSQVTQQECIADATEHWRRNKGRCNGAIYWQFNDCWPVCSWSGIDYFGSYKALQYTARNVNAPLSVSAENTDEYIKIFLLNDYNEEKTADIEYVLFDFESGELVKERKTVSAEKLRNTEVFDIGISELNEKYDLKRTGIAARLISDGKEIMSKTVLFGLEKNLDMPKAHVEKSVKTEDGKAVISLKTDKFARLVRLESSLSRMPFSDNYFDILPGGTKTVTVLIDPAFSEEEFINSISVMSLSDIKTRPITKEERRALIKMYFLPETVGNRLYHGRKPRDWDFDKD